MFITPYVGLYTKKKEDPKSDCGANAQGGGGFQAGNTCATGESGSKPKAKKKGKYQKDSRSRLERFDPVGDTKNSDYAKPPTEDEIRKFLAKNKHDGIGKLKDIEEGEYVGLRIDIPTYEKSVKADPDNPIYAVTVHEAKPTSWSVGKALTYEPVARVTGGVQMRSAEKGAEMIMDGKNKWPLATVAGKLSHDTSVPKDINKWTPVGYNPQHAVFFYDKRTGKEIMHADEAVSIGNTVFVKKPKYGDRKATDETYDDVIPTRELKERVKPKWFSVLVFKKVAEEPKSDCGANAQGGGGFQEGNTCATGESAEGGKSSGQGSQENEEGQEGEKVYGEGNVERSAVKYFTMDESEIPEMPKQKGKVQLFDVVNHLEKENEAIGEIHMDTEGGTDMISDALADEALYALKQDDSAIGWYDKKMKAAMGIIHEAHPELKDNPDKESFYKSLIAITSNGQDVVTNFEIADKIYKDWKTTGRIDSSLGEIGPQGQAIKEGLEGLQTMVDQKGLSGTREFMNKEFTVKQLKDAGFKVSGELMESKFKGSNVFGPKIGSFYGNLNGDFSTVTMDRWFMRTHNRIAGTLTNIAPQKVEGHAMEILDELDDIDASNPMFDVMSKQEVERELEYAIENPHKIQDMPQLEGWLNRRRLDYSVSRKPKLDKEGNQKKTKKGKLQWTGYADKTGISKGSKKFHENIHPIVQAPKGGAHRAWVRESVSKAQQKLKKAGHDISIADLQALLWYNEKRLYKRFGYTAKGTETVDYEDAARAVLKGQK